MDSLKSSVNLLPGMNSDCVGKFKVLTGLDPSKTVIFCDQILSVTTLCYMCSLVPDMACETSSAIGKLVLIL